MHKIQLNILSGILALITFPYLVYGLGLFLSQSKLTDDYGYSGPYFLEWVYDLFIFRDGLYDAPNLWFYLTVFVFTFIMVRKLVVLIFHLKDH